MPLIGETSLLTFPDGFLMSSPIINPAAANPAAIKAIAFPFPLKKLMYFGFDSFAEVLYNGSLAANPLAATSIRISVAANRTAGFENATATASTNAWA